MIRSFRFPRRFVSLILIQTTVLLLGGRGRSLRRGNGRLTRRPTVWRFYSGGRRFWRRIFIRLILVWRVLKGHVLMAGGWGNCAWFGVTVVIPRRVAGRRSSSCLNPLFLTFMLMSHRRDLTVSLFIARPCWRRTKPFLARGGRTRRSSGDCRRRDCSRPVASRFLVRRTRLLRLIVMIMLKPFRRG